MRKLKKALPSAVLCLFITAFQSLRRRTAITSTLPRTSRSKRSRSPWRLSEVQT